MTGEARNQAFKSVMRSDDRWNEFASKVFKDPSSAIALEIRKRGKAGTIDEAGLRQMLGGASVRGELRKGVTGSAAQREFLMLGAQGETEGVSRTDLPTTGKAGADIDAQIKALVESTGSLVDAIKTLIEREKNK